jgi:hypothetical protein
MNPENIPELKEDTEDKNCTDREQKIAVLGADGYLGAWVVYYL